MSTIWLGKYSTPNKERNIKTLGGRLAKAIHQAIGASRKNRFASPSLEWKTSLFDIPCRIRKPNPAWRKVIADSSQPVHERVYNACKLGAWLDRRHLRRQAAVSLKLGPCQVIHLPGEVFVEYQLYGQQLQPSRFLAFTALGDCTAGYLPTARAFDEGGYEPSELATVTTPAIERKLKKAIASVAIAGMATRRTVQNRQKM
ncbi:MAG: hypothetical protein PHV34_24305 [Verrucomicrobiae bacterium]|nr:hypothetical protein [Verrucomicrobiae bacterium]